ncbi:MAG: hypothetical protein QOE23_1984 [Pseudonocardiales bacterium]|jgi:hypothetical protein|nr:hypothetical protein [Pseudonocardiales bacterium]
MGGHPDRATLVLRFQAGRTARDVDAMAAAALGLAAQHQFGTQVGRTPAYLHEAYQLASGPLRVQLAAALARTWVYGSEPARAVPFAVEAVAEAERCGNPALLAEALDADLLVHWGPDDLAERLRITARLEDTVAHLPEVESRLSAHLWRFTTALESLDPVSAQRQLRALDELAEESGSPRARLFAVSRRATQALIAGNLEAVRELLAETGRAGDEAGEPDTPALLHELGAHVALQCSDRAELAEQAAAFEEFGTEQGVMSIAAEGGWLWLAAGVPSRARALLDRLGPLRAVPRDVDWLLTLCVLTEVAAGTGALEVAADAVELLTPYAGRGVVNAGGVTFVGVVDDYLRMACEALGLSEDAARWAGGATAGYQRMGATWWLRRLAGSPARVEAVVFSVSLFEVDGVWTIGSSDRLVSLPERKGFRYLGLLLARPGAEVPALELVAAVAGNVGAQVADGDLGEVIDRQALLAYRRRIADLDEELAEARSWSDGSRVATLTAERGMLLDEVGAATGLAGRRRVTGAASERARVAVTKAIASALKAIADADPALGRLLRDTIRTGTACCYEPDPSRPVEWVLSGPSDGRPST